jgi:DNA-binding transcriptional LysR family regulator
VVATQPREGPGNNRATVDNRCTTCNSRGVETFDLARLEALVTLASELHFGRSAERLGIEVSTLSRRIHRLEEQLDVELFTRSSRRVRLTSAGAAITRQAERVLAEAEALEATAAEAAAGRVGELRAAFSSSSTEPMARLLRELRERRPNLTVVAHRGPSATIAADVALGHLSFGICQGGEWLDSVALAQEVIGSMAIDRVMLPVGHRLAERDVLDAADLEDETLIWPPASLVPTTPQVLPVPTRVRRSGAWEEPGLVDDVAAGYGVYICTADAAERNPRPDIVVRPLTGTDARAEHCFVWRVDDDDPALRAVRTLIDEIRD